MLNHEWFLLKIKPNSHKIAKRNLDRQGFSNFTPMLEVTETHLEKFKKKFIPLFPGYMFVKVSTTTNQWRAINNTIGVSSLVVFGNEPKALSTSLVDGLMRRCDRNHTIKYGLGVTAGDKVNIVSGPLSKFVAKIEKIEENKRVWMLLDLLGRQTRVSISKEKVTNFNINS